MESAAHVNSWPPGLYCSAILFYFMTLMTLWFSASQCTHSLILIQRPYIGLNNAEIKRVVISISVRLELEKCNVSGGFLVYSVSGTHGRPLK